MGKNVKQFDENWENDDDKKIIGKVDRDRVACNSESWEKYPVFKKMKKENSHITNEELNRAFNECCKETIAPHMRDEFEKCMRRKLRIFD